MKCVANSQPDEVIDEETLIFNALARKCECYDAATLPFANVIQMELSLT